MTEKLLEPVKWFKKMEMKGKIFISTLLLIIIALVGIVAKLAVDKSQTTTQQSNTISTVEDRDIKEEFIKSHKELINGNIRMLESSYSEARERKDAVMLAKAYKSAYENSKKMLEEYDNLCRQYYDSYWYIKDECKKAVTPNKEAYTNYVIEIGMGDDDYTVDELAKRIEEIDMFRKQRSLGLKRILLEY
jgi:hypothetical protein